MQVLVRSGDENGSPPLSATHRRQRMSRGRPGRERRPHALFEAHAPYARTQKCGSHASAEDASFARSSDPCTLIATSTPSGQLAEVARWSRYRGRENLGNQEEPAPGSESASVARLAACHRFRKGEGVAGHQKKRKGITVPVPARIVRVPGSVPVRRSSCRSRQATSGPKYTRQTRTKKCGQGRANGGLGRGERGRSNVCERVERSDESHLGSSRTTTARDRDKAQGDVRASSSGRNIAKSGEVVAGPGL